MGFMYVQVAQQHRDIMREILGTRRKTKGAGMTTRDVFGKWKVFPQRIVKVDPQSIPTIYKFSIYMIQFMYIYI